MTGKHRKTPATICAEEGHKKKYTGAPFELYGSWQRAWECSRCEDVGTDEVDPPKR